MIYQDMGFVKVPLASCMKGNWLAISCCQPTEIPAPINGTTRIRRSCSTKEGGRGPMNDATSVMLMVWFGEMLAEALALPKSSVPAFGNERLDGSASCRALK